MFCICAVLKREKHSYFLKDSLKKNVIRAIFLKCPHISGGIHIFSSCLMLP